ncbi:4-hydroxybenzoate octaprenyltransferase [Qingshengfaniella alkalisoli]|uniref:4-hydroxybenzoate octaprenyltransferase n=1 Tax=Qingshengfaniella alkalisoli TaxID=2599296 RepID=A0A5B8IXM9_9RHOB|nr:4-hydroxybenzoate octaprenyltransferase [Qingshengfaniella alkalisoli]QDY69691.1 4-hydroxybenzoate octaprenyltransferase [Qingshengfaniella alkalisoli]
MTQTTRTPEAGIVDAVKGNWVDRSAPDWAKPYLRLSRADRPIGTWLLLLPCWWGALLSAASGEGLSLRLIWILLACSAGAWLMRGAGCTWNDITDRDIDGSVERTRMRPIPSGQVSVKQALAWMVIQSLIALCLLLTFNLNAILLGFLSLATVAIYPFAKRFTWWPQIFLGLAFNWGALLAWTAESGRLGLPAIILYLAGIAWTLFYDTIYAHQDKEDDALIGVKSTARLFGEDTPQWLWRFAIASTALMAVAAVMAFNFTFGAGLILSLVGVAAFFTHMAWQMRILDIDDTKTCLRLFRSNRDAGLLAALFLAIAVLA